MSSPSSWLDKDIEKGVIETSELDEKITLPTDGSTTLADNSLQSPESENVRMTAHHIH